MPDFDWTDLSLEKKRELDDIGVWWIRTEIIVQDELDGHRLLGLIPNGFVSACELYWDGQLVGQNGRVAHSQEEETPGKFFNASYVPKNLSSPGTHTLVTKISNFRPSPKWKWHYGSILLGYYDKLLAFAFTSQVQVWAIIGVLIISFLFNLFLFFARERQPSHLVLALFCLAVITNYVVSYFWVFKNVDTTFISIELEINLLAATIIGVLFPTFFIYEFSFPFRRAIFGIFAFFLIFYGSYVKFRTPFDFDKYVFIFMLLFSIPVALWALIKKREGSAIALIGICLALAAFLSNLRPDISALSFASTVIIIYFNLSLSIKFARRERAEREAQLRSSRLELEVLKKSINPHFLMNSLTSIIAWLRKDPKTAVKLVEALAEEFRMISQISNLKAITLKRELELCRTHLEIMGYRRGARYVLDVDGVNEHEMVPPLLIHTLIENGLTHGYGGRNSGYFRFSRKDIGRGVQYVLFNDSAMGEESAHFSSGIGLRYAEIRLQEGYQNRWRLESRRVSQGWEVIIELYGERGTR